MNIPGVVLDPTVPPAGCICGHTACSPGAVPGALAGPDPGCTSLGPEAAGAVGWSRAAPRSADPGRAPGSGAARQSSIPSCHRCGGHGPCMRRLHGRLRWCYSSVCLREQNFRIGSFFKADLISTFNKHVSWLDPFFNGPDFFSVFEEDDSLLPN